MMKLATAVPFGSAQVSPLRTLSELSELHKKGVITDSEFETLARVTASSLVESEVGSRINPLMSRIQMHLMKLLSKEELAHDPRCPYCGSHE